MIEGHLDLDRLIALAAQAEPVPLASASLFKIDVPTRPVRIALAQDEAFSFYYADGLDLLTAAGADLVRFSPIHDASLPSGAQGLYIGGGFPELFGDQLEANGRMRREILERARDGMPIYAECGGLMYLTEAIVDFDGTSFPMVGAVPGRAVMERGRLRIGYVEVEPLGENILAGPGTRLRGHEFHCAQWDGGGSARPAYRILNLDGRSEGYQCGNLLATFVHLHLATDPSLAGRFVASCALYPKK
jgi:cobyrinic acid a,c-diamide synthase